MHYVTLLFRKVISLCNVLLSVNLVGNAMLLRYITRYISNVLYYYYYICSALYITALL